MALKTVLSSPDEAPEGVRHLYLEKDDSFMHPRGVWGNAREDDIAAYS